MSSVATAAHRLCLVPSYLLRRLWPGQPLWDRLIISRAFKRLRICFIWHRGSSMTRIAGPSRVRLASVVRVRSASPGRAAQSRLSLRGDRDSDPEWFLGMRLIISAYLLLYPYLYVCIARSTSHQPFDWRGHLRCRRCQPSTAGPCIGC